MKTLKETVIVCLFMLMVSMNVMAQRETLTFNGIMANFPHGGSAETVLTIKPDGKYVFDVKKSKTVEPFTISGQMPVLMFDMPGKDGKRGPKAEGFNWVLPVSDFTMITNMGAKYPPVTGKQKGMVMGKTEKERILLKLSLKVPQSDTLSYPVTLECTLKR